MDPIISEKNEKHLNQSIKLSQKALSLDSENIQAHIVLGGSYLKKEKPDETVKFLEKALKLNPESADLETIYLYLGQAYCAKGLFDQAVSCFKKVTKEELRLAGPYFLLAAFSCERDDYNMAESSYKEVVRVNPGYFHVYGALGSAYVFLGKYLEAIKSFSKNMEINGRNSNDICGMGVCLLAASDYSKMIKYLMSALTQDEISGIGSESVIHLRQIGKCALKAVYGSSEESLEWHQCVANILVVAAFEKIIYIKFEKRIKLKSYRTLPLFLIVAAYLGQKEYELAREMCQKIIESGNDTDTASFFLARCSAIEKIPLSEIEICKKALEKNGQDIKAALKLTRIYIEENQYDLALAYGQRALNISPDNSLANFYVGFLYSKRGWIYAALPLLERSVKLDNSNMKALFLLGETYLAVDNKVSAGQVWRKVVELDAGGEWGRKAGLKLEEKTND